MTLGPEDQNWVSSSAGSSPTFGRKNRTSSATVRFLSAARLPGVCPTPLSPVHVSDVCQSGWGNTIMSCVGAWDAEPDASSARCLLPQSVNMRLSTSLVASVRRSLPSTMIASCRLCPEFGRAIFNPDLCPPATSARCRTSTPCMYKQYFSASLLRASGFRLQVPT